MSNEVRVRVDHPLSWINAALFVLTVCAAFDACGDDKTFGEAVGEMVGASVRELSTGYAKGRALPLEQQQVEP